MTNFNDVLVCFKSKKITKSNIKLLYDLFIISFMFFIQFEMLQLSSLFMNNNISNLLIDFFISIGLLLLNLFLLFLFIIVSYEIKKRVYYYAGW